MTRLNILQGTLDLLVLKVLSVSRMHGYAIARIIQETSREMLQVEEGSLYPALYRMEKRGWIRSEWKISETNRRARYYELTAAGRKQLVVEEQNWEALTKAVERVRRLG
jgi:transcriptional regulator